MARHEMAAKKLVYEMPGVDAVSVRRDVVYRETADGALGMDLYDPPRPADGAPPPAVVFIIGVSDIGARAHLGCAMKEMESYIGWARLAALSGMVGILYGTGTDPASDTLAALDAVQSRATSLGIDAARVGVWGASANGPMSLFALMQPRAIPLRCAALYCPYSLDLDGGTEVADAQKVWGFKNPAAGRSVADLPGDLPMFIARAGRDQFAGLNTALDRFAAAALARNLPITLVNHATGPHAFDLMDDSDASRAIVRQTLGFLRQHLRAEV
jgi:dienelactone hydrolase